MPGAWLQLCSPPVRTQSGCGSAAGFRDRPKQLPPPRFLAPQESPCTARHPGWGVRSADGSCLVRTRGPLSSSSFHLSHDRVFVLAADKNPHHASSSVGGAATVGTAAGSLLGCVAATEVET